jgi:hypothetical protein
MAKQPTDNDLSRPRWRRWAIGMALLAVVALPTWHYRERLLFALFPAKAVGGPVTDTTGDEARRRNATRGLKGFIVWSSNRSGNHDILMLSFPDWTTTRLTTNPHTEYFPRVSPDGQWVAFARSQTPTASQREAEPWDVYAVHVATGREKLVARNGNMPTWSQDGRYIYFKRGTGQFVQRDFASGAETVLFEAGRGPIRSGVELHTPAYSAAHSAMAVTMRRGEWHTFIVGHDGSETIVGTGCQLNWAPDTGTLYWVGHGGKMRNQILRYDWTRKTAEPWLDLPEPFSNEYFPKLSADGTYLVLGASAGGHEHDLADYEIFLWRIGTPAKEAVRLTYHSGNDNWPDIYLRN